MPKLDLVTGAFSYTGRSIARRLFADGRRVRTLTGHPPADGEDGGVEVHPYTFEDPDALARSFEGVDTFFNTYWIRFPRRGVGFEDAVRNSERLFRAAERAGVRRIVHVSITNPSLDSPYPYFRGKAEVERALAATPVEWAVVRPTVVFGREDILVNNIAWLLRRFPVFAIPGWGPAPVRPIHVEDVARLCVEAAAGPAGAIVDAVGPEVFRFEELVRLIRDSIGSRTLLVRVPPFAVSVAGRVIGAAVRDVPITPEELGGLVAGLVSTEGPATGLTVFSEWLRENRGVVGRRYANELARHYRLAA